MRPHFFWYEADQENRFEGPFMSTRHSYHAGRSSEKEEHMQVSRDSASQIVSEVRSLIEFIRLLIHY